MSISLPLLLCGYSLPHLMGYLPTRAGEMPGTPLSPLELLSLANELGLQGVECPLTETPSVFDGVTATVDAGLDALLEQINARSYGSIIVADYGALLDHEPDHLITYCKRAATYGARIVRCIPSHILCGDRRGFPAGWTRHRELLAQRLGLVLPHIEQLGITLAIENHQDVTSDDLMWLFENSGYSSAFGITLDTGNPLAVCEDPLEYALRIAPLIRHVHLKDYTIHRADNGYRLVRCAAGNGVIDFPSILAELNTHGHVASLAIEIAAQATRTIPMLEESWWQEYPTAQRHYLPAALRTYWQKCRPTEEPYASCWERGGSSVDVGREELELVKQSVNYFERLLRTNGRED